LTAEGRYPSFDGKNFDLEKAKEAQRVFHTFDEYAVGPLEFGAIQRLVADATAAGTSVVLLELPYMRDALGAIIPDGATRLEEFHQLLEQTAEGLQVPLITYRDMMNCRELFADFYHPNAAGTLLLSTLTARWLADAFPKVPVANRR
jgi:hypothetical protein